MSSNTNKILYYIRDHEITRRFFNPKLLVIPGTYLLVMIPWTPLELYLTIILGFLYILAIEWVVVYGIILMEKLQTIINQQGTIITLLEQKG